MVEARCTDEKCYTTSASGKNWVTFLVLWITQSSCLINIYLWVMRFASPSKMFSVTLGKQTFVLVWHIDLFFFSLFRLFDSCFPCFLYCRYMIH